MNTIPTTIGLETGAGRTEAHNGLHVRADIKDVQADARDEVHATRRS